jgi:hypothetical protein
MTAQAVLFGREREVQQAWSSFASASTVFARLYIA